MKTMQLPAAKSTDIVVQELSNETLIYNLINNKAMCLNHTSAYIWKNCDGKTNITQLAELFNKEFKLNINEDFVWLALDELNKADLITNYTNKHQDKMTRRKAILNLALPLAVLPLVTIVLAPMATQAASGTCLANPANTCVSAAECSDANTAGCADSGCTCGGFVCGGDSCCGATSISCA